MTERAAERIRIPGLDVAKAKRYSRTRLLVMLASTTWSVLCLAWFASDRRAARLRTWVGALAPDSRLRTPAFIALATILSWISSLPIAYLGVYRVERSFGLTRQTSNGWFGDQVKSLLLGVALQTPLLSAAYAVIRRRPRNWWLVLASATVPIAVVLSNLAPVLLMPIFNQFSPLRDDALATRIRALGERGGVRISDVYEMDMSRQSEKPNAMFTGLGGTKRIVLGDTLLDQFEDTEIEAVVAHELGHQVHGDIWRLIGFGAVSGFGMAWTLSRIGPRTVRQTGDRTGVHEIGDEASLPVLALLTTALGLLMMPIQAAFSRAIERRADRFALELTRDGAAYVAAMERLAVQSLADPDPPKPVVLLLYSHPPIADRILGARAAERRFRAESASVSRALERG